MGKGELGALVGAIFVGLIGTWLLFVLADWADNAFVYLALRLLAFTVPAVIAARVGYGAGFNAGREKGMRIGYQAGFNASQRKDAPDNSGGST